VADVLSSRIVAERKSRMQKFLELPEKEHVTSNFFVTFAA
jgi:hypothetical protein